MEQVEGRLERTSWSLPLGPSPDQSILVGGGGRPEPSAREGKGSEGIANAGSRTPKRLAQFSAA